MILVILRNRFPPENVDDCEFKFLSINFKITTSLTAAKYRALALPSAGTLPFLQTLFCDFGTGKDSGPYSDMPTFPNATYVCVSG